MALIKSSLPERIKLLRTERNLSQNALADRLGLSRGIIGNYEIGARAPDYETLKVFANFFDVSIDYLLGETNVRQRIWHDQQAQQYEKLLMQLKALPNDIQLYLHKLIEYSTIIETLDSLSDDSMSDLIKYIALLQLRDHAKIV